MSNAFDALITLWSLLSESTPTDPNILRLTLRRRISLAIIVFVLLNAIVAVPSLSVTPMEAARGGTDPNMSSQPAVNLFKVRTITTFVKLEASDFEATTSETDDPYARTVLDEKIEACVNLIRKMTSRLKDQGYVVQTGRIATNPFHEYLGLEKDDRTDNNADETIMRLVKERLRRLDAVLARSDVNFCSLGPSFLPEHTRRYCPAIVQSSPRFSCSANVDAGDVEAADAAAECVQTIAAMTSGNGQKRSDLEGGLGNFRFCTTSRGRDFIPFFPVARCQSLNTSNDVVVLDGTTVGFALGLENGELLYDLLSKCGSISMIPTVFGVGMRAALVPLERICRDFVVEEGASSQTTGSNDKVSIFKYSYLGIDNSLNPSLSNNGSVGRAIECLEEVQGDFGGPGTLAATAALTTTLQSMHTSLTGEENGTGGDEHLTLVGYCGLMLPVCEDLRLSELSSLKIPQLLSISSVCGVGVDTVPLPGKVSREALRSLILDVGALAGRWDKSLSCRVFPVPGLEYGRTTSFNSPHLCNCKVFNL